MSERNFKVGALYPEMEGDTPFAQEFNRRMNAYYLKDPKAVPQSPQDVMLEILMDEYDRTMTPKDATV